MSERGRGITEDVDGLGLASAGRALNNVRTQKGEEIGRHSVPTGMEWNGCVAMVVGKRGIYLYIV